MSHNVEYCYRTMQYAMGLLRHKSNRSLIELQKLVTKSLSLFHHFDASIFYFLISQRYKF